jgi:hypothetical protein
MYFHITNEFLYIVQNNGADGDDWSRNNYPTGGAGAIVMKVKKTDDVEEFIQSAREFEQKTIADFLN